MIRGALVEYCSPTLANIKTGSLFALRCTENGVRGELRELNRMLLKKGLRILPIKKESNMTLLYLYRPKRLEMDLHNPEAKAILLAKGYDSEDAGRCLVSLVNRLAADKDFPHEIGLFLGYPPNDVKCFMENGGECAKCVGCWKSYGDPEQARKIFEKYKKCTEYYRTEKSKGRSLEQLIVVG